MGKLYQNEKNGQIVEFINQHGEDCAMVKNQSGQVSYVYVQNLKEWSQETGRTAVTAQPQLVKREKEKQERELKPPAIPPETRVNLNLATHQVLTTHLRGIGNSSAKQIIELRASLPDERFTNWDQLRQIKRVNWDAIIDEDSAWIG